MINACPLCLADEKTIDHLLVNCRVVWEVWPSILRAFDHRWVPPRSLVDLFGLWKAFPGSKKGKIMWRLGFVAVIGAVWKERNRRCFEGVASSPSVIAANAKFSVATWSSVPEFRGLSTKSIFYNWRVVSCS